MKSSIFFTLLFLLSFIQIKAQKENYSTILIPESLKKDADAVVRNSSVEYEVFSPSDAREVRHLAVTLLNNSSDMNELIIGYDQYSKVKGINTAIYDASGKLIRKIKKDEISDYSAIGSETLHSDSRVKYLEVIHNSYPYTIVYDYEVNHSGIYNYPDWNILPEPNISVISSSYTITMPSDLKLRYQAENIEIEPSISPSDNKQVYHWTTTNVKPVIADSYSSRLETIFPKVKIAPTKFSIAGYSGDMSSWKSFGSFIYKLNKGRDIVPQKVSNEVKKLTKNAKTDEEKVAIIYDYLQENTRYISIQLGIGGWQTFTSEFVAEKKYGDCKALTYYMKGMLREVGINSYPALVYAGSNFRKVDEDFTQPYFNHIILCVPQEEKDDIWLECTSKYDPSNHLGAFTENRKVLLLTPEGGKLVSTPHKDHKHHRRITHANVVIAKNGAAHANVQTQYYEKEQSRIRECHYEATQLQKEEFLKEQLDIASFEIENMDLMVYEDEARADWNFDISLPKYYKKSGKRLFLYANLLNRISKIPAENNNNLPIERIFGYTHLDTINYEIPQGYTLENIAQENFSLETEFGKYEIKVIVDKNKITYIRHLEMYQYSLPKEKYSELRDFYSTIVKMDKMKMVLVLSA